MTRPDIQSIPRTDPEKPDCTEPLSDSLKLAKEQLNRGIQEKQENQLNLNGGAGGKGACAPQAMPAKAQN